MTDEKLLIKEALEAQKSAYAPYSNFRVGAALLTAAGKIYRGCNIESASFTPTSCAERTAFCKAVSEGERDFAAIAVVGSAIGAQETDFCPPCGVCRQFMREFCGDDFRIFLVRKGKAAQTEIRETTLGELFPFSFDKRFL